MYTVLSIFLSKVLHLKVSINSNAPDFASRATRPSAALYPQLFSVPLTFSLVSFIGIIVSSSSQTIYGEAIWSPIDLLGKFLDDSPSSATRFGVGFSLPPLNPQVIVLTGLHAQVWFISASFIIAQVFMILSIYSLFLVLTVALHDFS